MSLLAHAHDHYWKTWCVWCKLFVYVSREGEWVGHVIPRHKVAR